MAIITKVWILDGVGSYIIFRCPRDEGYGGKAMEGVFGLHWVHVTSRAVLSFTMELYLDLRAIR